MSRTRQVTSNPASSSQVQIASQSTSGSTHGRISGILRLRAEDLPTLTNPDEEGASARRIRWSEEVIDNEGMGKKSSKVCCIYHKSHPVGESSSESDSSDSDDSSDADSDGEISHRGDRVNCSRRAHTRGRKPSDDYPSYQSLEGEQRLHCSKSHHDKSKRRKPSPNAYEKMPKATKK